MRTKVLMATMGMDIGGAETHILELSKGLVDQGYDVIVVSNGGAFVKPLLEKGIRHYRVPLHDKKPWNVMKSYYQLKKIIKREKVDIVHAHARIPAFLCGLIHRKGGFKFVTTAHFDFKTGMGLKYITNWGQKTLAVSNDLKKYLITNYNTNPEDIRVTINGIDTEAFSPNIPIKSLENPERFQNSFNLLQVLRLEDYTIKTAESLIHHTKELVAIKPNLKLIIVGDGSAFQRLKTKADQVNKEVGREVVYMEGRRTNISDYVGVSHAFVGVSRSALEAMSMELPIVLSGNQGYMGIYSMKKLKDAIGNNFTCRGEAPFKEEILLRDVSKLLKMSEEEMRIIGKDGRKTVIEYYSVNRMVSDAIKTYEDAFKLKKNIRTLIFGYIGFGNNGDDAIFNILKKNLMNNYDSMSITVLSNDPDNIERSSGIKGAYGFNPLRVLREMKNSDLIIGNGGSLLQDETSTRSLFYYLSIISCAKLFRKKVVLFANGIGPIKKNLNRRFVKRVVDKVDLITLRDKASYKLLKEIGVTKPSMYVTADVVFTLEGCSKEVVEKLLEEESIPMDKPLVGVAFRQWKKQEEYIPIVARICDRLIKEKGVNILFVPMQRIKKINDYELSRKIMSHMKEDSYILEGKYNTKELMGIMSQMQITFCMRFHAIVFSLLGNVPSLGIIYDPKIKNYLELFDLPSAYINDLNEDKIVAQLTELLRDGEGYQDNIEKKKIILRKKAEENIYYLEKYIDRWF